ncbi:hypothetical protein ABFS83_03G039600 [Erythranthe nasuta]
MDAYPPLPADYVSFAQLQERWIQKQEQEKLKSKQEDEKLKREAEEIQSEIRNRSGSRNGGHGKPLGASRRDAPPRVVGNDGGEMGGAIQAKGKGKEAAIGGSENGDGNNLRKKKNKRNNRRYEKKNKSDEIEKEKSKSDEVEGVDEIIANVSILPKDSVRSEVKGIERLDIGGGVRRNGRSNNRVHSGYRSNVSILPKDAVMSEVKGVEEIIANVSILPNDAVRSEVNGVEETANVSILPTDALRSEIRGLERLDIGGGFRRNGQSNNRVRWGYKSNVSILPKDSARSEMKGFEEIANVSNLPKDEVRIEIPGLERLDIGGGVRRNGRSNNRVHSGYKSNVSILPKHAVRSEVNGVEEIANVSILSKDAVSSEIPGFERLDIGGGVGRNGRSNNRVRSDYKSRTEYRVRVNGNEMKSVFEEKESKPNVEPNSDRVVEGESVSDDRENGEKGIKYRRDRKLKENINRESGRYGFRWKPKPRESGVMMWVKKEDKPAA